MTNTKTPLFFLVLLITWALAACGSGQTPLPTTIPLAVLPQGTATSSLPPTQDISTRAAVTAVPEVTRKPTPTPTPVNALINISDPRANAVLTMGSEITVRGLVDREETQTIGVTLQTSNGRVLAEVPGTPNEIGWEATFVIPPNVSGLATLQATLNDEAGNVLSVYETPVLLNLNKEASERYLELFRPVIDQTAVSGYNIFFDGEVFLPANNTISISIWAEECQTRVARQNFVLGRSSRPFYWQGFVVVPDDLVGPACAVASFGEPGSENWREAQVPITVLPPDDINARGVTIGNPPPDGEVTAGEDLLLYGTALNVAEGPVDVSILMDNGRVVSQSSITTDYWGYWETSVFLPADVVGIAEITVTAGEGDTTAETTGRVSVLPAPTPTPGP